MFTRHSTVGSLQHTASCATLWAVEHGVEHGSHALMLAKATELRSLAPHGLQQVRKALHVSKCETTGREPPQSRCATFAIELHPDVVKNVFV